MAKFPITKDVVETAIAQIQVFEDETNPKMEAFVEENKEKFMVNPNEALKEMDQYLTEFGESIGIEPNAEYPIVEVSGDPIQSALQIRGFYIGILAARIVAERKAHDAIPQRHGA